MRIREIKTDDVRYPGYRVRITGDIEHDLACAIWADHHDQFAHPDDYCGDSTCDITAAVRRGHVLAAAWLLLFATDAHATERVLGAYRLAGKHVPSLGEAFGTWCYIARRCGHPLSGPVTPGCI